eukprot:683923-Rhodomonas_salina.1
MHEGSKVKGDLLEGDEGVGRHGCGEALCVERAQVRPAHRTCNVRPNISQQLRDIRAATQSLSTHVGSSSGEEREDGAGTGSERGGGRSAGEQTRAQWLIISCIFASSSLASLHRSRSFRVRLAQHEGRE